VDKHLDEQHLATLSSRLPEECIVLLEDIDSAGLVRDMDTDDATDSEDNTENSSSENALARKKDAQQANGTPPKKVKSISLSGLLNIIDGGFLQSSCYTEHTRANQSQVLQPMKARFC
jgi:chaperone BCS1